MTTETTHGGHVTVLLQEAVDALNVQSDGVYVDGTYGRGGHSRRILSGLGKGGRLFVFDKDPQAVSDARQLAETDRRVSVIHDGFRALESRLRAAGVDRVSGILLDLGVSSPQLDEAERGFSFRFDAPLDMRMDTTKGMSATDWVNSADAQELYEVIRDYGEERFARRVAHAIVTAREEEPIRTTGRLARIAADAVPTRERGQNPATRTFQAVRIHINRELEEIKEVLPQAVRMLETGGRLVVIAFHSLEDRIVKRFVQHYSKPEPLPRWAVLREDERALPPLTVCGKAQKASVAEVTANPRARSAVLRIAERTSGAFDHG